MTSSLQAYSCGTSYAALTVGLVMVYGTVSLSITQWRTKFRVQMNKADNAAGTKAVDSLINFETVKVTIFTCVYLLIWYYNVSLVFQ